MAKYLDEDGLKHLWSKIDGRFDTAETAIAGAGVKISYDSKAKTIKLLDKENNQLGESIDASVFIKDGMLDDVELITVSETNPVDGYENGDKLFKFTWNTDGDEKIDYVNVTELGVDPNTDNTETTKDIRLVGGPLADLCKNIYADGTIPAGTSMQDLLEKLFYSENWSTVSISNGASNVKATLSITTNLSKANNSVVKIGSTVTINEPTLTQTENKANATISGFDYGKYSLDGTSKITGTSVSKTWSYDKTNQPTYSISGYSGFGLTATPAVGDTLTVALGDNTIKTSATGAAWTASCEQVGPVYDVSNLDNIATEADNIYTIETQTKEVVVPTCNPSEVKIIGVYPIYTNANNAGNVENPTVEIVKNNSVFEVEYGPETSYYHMFAYPASHTLSKVENFNPQSQQYGDYIGGSNTTDSDIVVNGQAYKLWTRAGAANTEKTKYKFTLDKLTSKA